MKEINKNTACDILVIDVHCPHLKGTFNEQVYLVGTESTKNFQEQCKLLKIIETNNYSPLPFSSTSILPFGEGWNKTTTDGTSNSVWCTQQNHVKLATSLEIPYAVAMGNEVNQQTARELGAVIAKSLLQYCR